MEKLKKSLMPNNSPDSTHTNGSNDSYGLSEKEFFPKLLGCIYDNSQLNGFMEDAEFHPPHGWHKFMLYVHHVQSSSQFETFRIDASTLSNFFDELVANFPDVLQRVLLRGAYEISGEDKFGAVHVSALCCQAKVVELLTKLESKVIIKNCLTESLKHSKEELNIIERALLWSNLKKSTEDSFHSQSMVNFMRKFKAATRSDSKEALDNLIADANLHPKDGWQTVLLWASARGENYILRKFKDECSQLFIDIKEKSQKDGFSPLRATSTRTGKDVSTKIKQDLHDLINDLIDRADDRDYRELLAQNLHHRTGHGWTPLHIVVILQNEAMLSLLMECYDSYQTWGKMADRLDSRNKIVDTKQQKHIKGYSYNGFNDDFWMTPLHYAVISGNENIVSKMLSWETFKPHVNSFNLFICTAFHMACRRQEGSSLMEILIASSSININVQDCCSFSPLHWAVYVGATNCIRSLLTRADDTNRPMRMNDEDIHGRSAFSLAMDNETWKLLTCIPEVKQEIERLYRDRQVYVDAANAVSVGAALIGGVTYAGWSQPLTTSSYDHQYVAIYWAFNSLSFFFSIGALMAGIATVLPMEDIYIGKGVKNIREWLIFTSFLMIISIIFVLGAFTSAGFASLDSPNSRLKQNLLVTSCMGCCLCGMIGIVFLLKLYAINRKWSHKCCLYLVKFIGENFCRIQKQFGISSFPIIHKPKSELQLGIKEDWNIIGKKWRGKELKWKRLRGIHHISQVSTSLCRKYALHSDRFTYDELLLECNRLKEIGVIMAEEIENIECEQCTPKNEITKIKHLFNVDED